jgi:hypothetical protein
MPLLPLWAVRPVQSLSTCTRVHFTFRKNTVYRRVTVSVYVPVILMGSGTFANKSGFRNVMSLKVIGQGSNVVSCDVILLGDWSCDSLFPPLFDWTQFGLLAFTQALFDSSRGKAFYFFRNAHTGCVAYRASRTVSVVVQLRTCRVVPLVSHTPRGKALH